MEEINQLQNSRDSGAQAFYMAANSGDDSTLFGYVQGEPWYQSLKFGTKGWFGRALDINNPNDLNAILTSQEANQSRAKLMNQMYGSRLTETELRFGQQYMASLKSTKDIFMAMEAYKYYASLLAAQRLARPVNDAWQPGAAGQDDYAPILLMMVQHAVSDPRHKLATKEQFAKIAEQWKKDNKGKK